MIGSPPNCRPECIINADCPTDKACINRKCQDPCPGLCGINAKCDMRNHIPTCICNTGFIGDPFAQCYRPSTAPRPIKVVQPCNPSPCGINAECSENRGAASCSCILDYVGNPYVECKPEFTINPECPRDKACNNNKWSSLSGCLWCSCNLLSYQFSYLCVTQVTLEMLLCLAQE